MKSSLIFNQELPLWAHSCREDAWPDHPGTSARAFHSVPPGHVPAGTGTKKLRRTYLTTPSTTPFLVGTAHPAEVMIEKVVALQLRETLGKLAPREQTIVEVRTLLLS